MAFELTTATKTKVLDVRTLAAKDRKPDEPPGAQLLLQATLPVATLAMFDGFLPGMLYRKAGAAGQGKLDGMEGEELTSIGEHVKRLPWVYEQTGCTVEIERIGGGKRNLKLEDCKMHRVSFQPQQGGSVRVQWTIDAPGLSDELRGKLTGLKATEPELKLSIPEVADDQQQIPGTEGTDPNTPPAEPNRPDGWPFPKGNRPQGVVPDQPDATSTFVAAHTEPAGDSAAANEAGDRQIGDTTVTTKRPARTVRP